MAVTAKFKVSRITHWSGQEGEKGEVELTPDYAQGRNAEWAEATPAGVIRLTISNPSAFKQFSEGDAYTVILEKEAA